jgi:hypothetical protein
MTKRFISIQGTPIPPFKETKLGNGSVSIRFVIKGNIVSKKNNNLSVTIRKAARDYLKKVSKNGTVSIADAQKAVSMTTSKVMPNLEYKKWLQEQKPLIQEQMQEWSKRLGSKGLIFPIDKCKMYTKFYFANNYRSDLSNKQFSIEDLLVDCKVIQDDCYFNIPQIEVVGANYKDELIDSLCVVVLTFRLDSQNGNNSQI